MSSRTVKVTESNPVSKCRRGEKHFKTTKETSTLHTHTQYFLTQFHMPSLRTEESTLVYHVVWFYVLSDKYTLYMYAYTLYIYTHVYIYTHIAI